MSVLLLATMFFRGLLGPDLGPLDLHYDRHTRAFYLRYVEHLVHPIDQRLLEPGLGHIRLVMEALDQDFIVHCEDGRRLEVPVTLLPKEAKVFSWDEPLNRPWTAVRSSGTVTALGAKGKGNSLVEERPCDGGT